MYLFIKYRCPLIDLLGVSTVNYIHILKGMSNTAILGMKYINI